MSTPSFLDSRGASTIVVGRGGVTVIGTVFGEMSLKAARPLDESKYQRDEKETDSCPTERRVVSSDSPAEEDGGDQHQRELGDSEWSHWLSLFRLVNRFTPSRKAGVARASALAMIPAEMPSMKLSVSSL